MRKKGWFILFSVVLVFIVNLALCENGARELPVTEKTEITAVLQKTEFSDSDYDFLFRQTGLGKTAIEDIKAENGDFTARILAFQEQYFTPVEYDCEYIFFPTTKEEQIKGGRTILPPLRDGDILITKGTHTLGFRHGHAAIVVDAAQGKTVESILLGQKSSEQDVSKWRSYPSLLILRPKDAPLAKQAAEFAKQHLLGVDYGLFVGLLRKDKQAVLPIDSTHCAHLVWQAYKAAGLDLDGDGWLVLPQEIAASPQLDVVFAFGFDAQRRWQ